MKKSTVGPAVVLAATAALAAGCSSDGSGASADPATPDTTSSDSTGSTGSGTYTAGTYEAEGDYTNPDGPAAVQVSITLDASGTVEDVTVTPEATGGNSLAFQTAFADGIAAEVVGQNIADINVDKVAGSSLTGAGFNAAAADIASQASA